MSVHSVNPRLMTSGVAVEKLRCGRMAKITSRQDALQTILRGRLTICHPPKSCRFCEYRLFQQPQANALNEISSTDRYRERVLCLPMWRVVPEKSCKFTGSASITSRTWSKPRLSFVLRDDVLMRVPIRH